MRTLQTGSVDFLFTDLPYGTTQCKWDTPINLEMFWVQANRVTKANGCKALFAQTPFDKVLGCSNLKELRYEWIWEKTQATGHFNAKKMPMKAHENILVFYASAATYNPQKTHGHLPVHSYTKYLDTQNKTALYGKATREIKGGGATDRYPRSVIKGPSDKQRAYFHPTQKPVWLCEQMVLTYTSLGDTVLDCCMGSASIGVACQNTGRSYIGIDNEKQWIDVAKTRLSLSAIFTKKTPEHKLKIENKGHLGEPVHERNLLDASERIKMEATRLWVDDETGEIHLDGELMHGEETKFPHFFTLF